MPIGPTGNRPITGPIVQKPRALFLAPMKPHLNRSNAVLFIPGVDQDKDLFNRFKEEGSKARPQFSLVLAFLPHVQQSFLVCPCVRQMLRVAGFGQLERFRQGSPFLNQSRLPRCDASLKLVRCLPCLHFSKL